MPLNMSTCHPPTYLQSILPEALHPFISLSYPIPPSPFSIPPFHSSTSSSSFFNSSYPSTLYDKGPKDLYFLLFCALGFTILREITIRYVLSTFARRWLISSRRKDGQGQSGSMGKAEKRNMEHIVLRFAEQGWSFLYCAVFWSLGVVSTQLILFISVTLVAVD